MSFLIDPGLLVAGGAAIERLVDDERTADLVAAGALTGVLAVSVSLWRDDERPLLRPIWRRFGSRTPRDFMVNSGVLRLPVPRAPGPREHLTAAALFATYPLFLQLGRRLGRRWRRRAAGPGGGEVSR